MRLVSRTCGWVVRGMCMVWQRERDFAIHEKDWNMLTEFHDVNKPMLPINMPNGETSRWSQYDSAERCEVNRLHDQLIK